MNNTGNGTTTSNTRIEHSGYKELHQGQQKREKERHWSRHVVGLHWHSIIRLLSRKHNELALPFVLIRFHGLLIHFAVHFASGLSHPHSHSSLLLHRHFFYHSCANSSITLALSHTVTSSASSSFCIKPWRHCHPNPLLSAQLLASQLEPAPREITLVLQKQAVSEKAKEARQIAQEQKEGLDKLVAEEQQKKREYLADLKVR